MEIITVEPADEVRLFVKNILLFEEKEHPGTTIIPFFADGYPGLVFHSTKGGVWVHPQDKQMPVTFLYGQTLHPIELHISGAYTMIVFQFYPFVLNSFFGINPKDLNDSCYDLLQHPSWPAYADLVMQCSKPEEQIPIISRFLSGLFQTQQQKLDMLIRESLELILHQTEQLTIAEICQRLFVSPRTFERRFLKEVGVSPRDFMQITRFQRSYEQLSVKDFNKLTDIVYANGFADQSHFIRVFKAFTGKTPTSLLKDL